MEKKGRKAVIALCAACAALIVAVSVLGVVYARDVTMGQDDLGSVTMGTWSVMTDVLAGSDTVPLTFGVKTLRPEAVKYSAESARTHESDYQKFLDVGILNSNSTNDITSIVHMVDYEKNEDGSAKASLHWEEGFVWGQGFGDGTDDDYTLGLMGKFGFTDGDETCKARFEDLVNSYGVFSLTFAWVNPNYPSVYNPLTPGEYHTPEGVVDDASDIYVMVTWKSVWEGKGVEQSPPTGFDSWEEYSDAVDTVIGTYADAISFMVTWEVAQNRELSSQT